MLRKLTVVALVVGLCLMGVIPVLAQKVYPTLDEYEKLTGKEIEAFNEAPSLKTKVAAGELPPVEERLSEEPMVMEPLEETGQYGGMLKGVATAPTWAGGDNWNMRAQVLFRLMPDLKTIVANIPKKWDLSKDYKTLTIYLRKGMKWSDGAPFTADDFLFWYEDIILNDELTPVKPKVWSPGGKLVKVEKLNDYTVRFQFAAPYAPVINILTDGNEPFLPKQFLKKYHIKYNPRAGEIAKEEGYDEWWMCFNFHNLYGHGQKQQDINRPCLDTWVLTNIDSYGNKYYERNPYFWKMDTTGNQLPYINTQIRALVENPEVVNLKAIAGEFDAVGKLTTLENYPLYKEGEKKGDYRVSLWKGIRGSILGYTFNLTHKDPVLRKIFNDVRFRQAMSLAINRKEINDILFYGKATPRQATVIPSCSFYEPWMGEYYAEHDPKKANMLLDEMGLKWDKKHQYRLRPDGKPLAITAEYVRMEGPRGRICELAKDHWEKVGVKVAIKETQRALYVQRGKANELDVGNWSICYTTEYFMYQQPHYFRPPWGGGAAPNAGIPWWNWYASGGKSGEEPPEVIKRLFKTIEEWQTTLPGTEEYMKLGKEILTINLKNLFVIGTVGMAPMPVIMKSNLRNTPESGEWGPDYRLFRPYQPEQWFFKK